MKNNEHCVIGFYILAFLIGLLVEYLGHNMYSYDDIIFWALLFLPIACAHAAPWQMDYYDSQNLMRCSAILIIAYFMCGFLWGFGWIRLAFLALFFSFILYQSSVFQNQAVPDYLED